MKRISSRTQNKKIAKNIVKEELRGAFVDSPNRFEGRVYWSKNVLAQGRSTLIEGSDIYDYGCINLKLADDTGIINAENMHILYHNTCCLKALMKHNIAHVLTAQVLQAENCASDSNERLARLKAIHIRSHAAVDAKSYDHSAYYTMNAEIVSVFVIPMANYDEAHCLNCYKTLDEIQDELDIIRVADVANIGNDRGMRIQQQTHSKRSSVSLRTTVHENTPSVFILGVS
ncbi:hypothetical protein RF11_11534 [Thelohanellus kitauei]|uniref:Uncharacterized protein n=1 Tax=Thelohanellus kitauei TaxID=669202 RepID=A0A0C2NBI0_THEKT|nr:hypothetical protein RF11_11534 [Thelohanellus kitauei]